MKIAETPRSLETASLANTLLDSVADAFLCVDGGLRVTYANAAAARYMGVAAGDAVGEPLFQIWPDIRETAFEQKLREAVDSQEEVRFEGECLLHGAWFEVRCHPTPQGLAIQMLDCTERKQAEDALRKSELRLQSMLESLPAGAVLISGERLTLNTTVEKMLGYSKAELTTLDDWFRLTRSGDETSAAQARREYEAIKQRGFQHNFLRELIRKDGATRIVEVAAFLDEVGEVWLLHDLTDRLASEEKFRILFEQSTEAHVLISDNGIIDANQAALDMLRCSSRSQILGKQPSEFSPQYQPDGTLSIEKSRLVNEAAKRKGYHRFEWVHQSINGDLLPSEVTITELSIGGKSAQLVAWRDLTEQKESEARLRRGADELRKMTSELQFANERLIDARDAALESARAKSRFLAMVSHEIRTPLNGVMGMTNLLLATTLDPEQAEYVRTIQTSGQTLLRVIGDVLDLSKAEAGKLTIVPSEIDLAAVMTETVGLFQGQAFEKGLQLILEGVDKPIAVLADSVRLKQVIGNLVMNGLKFTPTGEVRVAVDVKELTEDYRVQITVSDTGIGIDPERLDSIFESFTQADDSTHRMFGGTGLGLTITRRLVELMGGKVSVESVVGRGSTFSFGLLLPQCLLKEKKPDAKSEGRVLSGLRVLVVEDNLVNVLVARRTLEILGCSVSVATSGDEAIRSAGYGTYDVVLMDVQMPGTDGLAATRAIHLEKPGLPVIALTANAMEDDRQACVDAGMVGFLAKPFTQVQLIELLVGFSVAAP